MKKTSFIILGFTIAITLLSCSLGMNCQKGEGDIISEDRITETFNSIALGINAEVELKQEENTSVSVSANKNLLPFIVTKVVDNTLIIETKDCDCVSSEDKISIHISSPKVKELSIAGSGGIISKGKIVTDNIELNIAGSGDIILEELATKIYSVNISGSGDVHLSGESISNVGSISISGSGNVNAKNFNTNNIDIAIAGSGDAKVSPIERLEVSIAGSGDVHYRGKPSLSVDIAGSGSVIQE